MRISFLIQILLLTAVSFNSFAQDDADAAKAISIGKSMNDESRTGKALAELDKTSNFETTSMEAGKGNEAVRKCKEVATTARKACLANFSEHIQTGAALVQVLVSGMGMMSTSEACSKYSDTLKKVQVAMTLYNAACSGFQMRCSSVCTTGLNQINTSNANLNVRRAQLMGTPGGQAMIQQINWDMEYLQAMGVSIKNQISICEGYKMNLAAAAAGTISTLSKINAAKSCEKATTVGEAGGAGSEGGSGEGGLSSAVAENVDCSMEKHAQKPECICQKSPNAPGCPGYMGSSSLAGPSGSGGPTGADPKGAIPTTGISGLTNGGDNNSGGFVSPTGSRSPMAGGGSGGGGGGGLGGGGSGGSKAGGADATKKGGSTLNANIISGYDGGGGGGGRGGGRGGGFDPSSSKYKAYLPGGAKDPTRGLASQTFANGQVTGAGAKSNWEKINDRYRDNKSTLMGK